MDWTLFFDPILWTKTGLSILCGFVVGIERQIHNKPIDIRTSILICLGTMLFIHLGASLDGEKDSSRVLSQIVTGVGFLGAGAIVTRSGLVMGITSAAVVWVQAGIGAAIGFGYYETGLAVSVSVVMVLTVLHWLDRVFTKILKITVEETKRTLKS